MSHQHSGAEKIKKLMAALEKITKERDDLRQELSKPNVICACLADVEQIIKKLKLDFTG